MLTLAKSLVSLSYRADEVGERMQSQGGASGGPRRLGFQVGRCFQIQSSLTLMGGWLSRIFQAELNRASSPQQRKRRVFHPQSGSVLTRGFSGEIVHLLHISKEKWK